MVNADAEEPVAALTINTANAGAKPKAPVPTQPAPQNNPHPTPHPIVHAPQAQCMQTPPFSYVIKKVPTGYYSIENYFFDHLPLLITRIDNLLP